MAQLQHLLSDESRMTLETVIHASKDPEVVTEMTREKFNLHMEIRTALGADPDELIAKCEAWNDARDVHELFKAAMADVKPLA